MKSDSNAPNVLVLEGAAIGAAGAKAEIEKAVGSGVTVDADKLGPLKQDACSLVDELRAIHSERSLLTSAQTEYELRVDGSIGFPGKLGIRTEQTLDIGAPEKDFSVYGVDPDGSTTFLMDRAKINDMVAAKRVTVLDNDRYRLGIEPIRLAARGHSGHHW